MVPTFSHILTNFNPVDSNLHDGIETTVTSVSDIVATVHQLNYY